jgi:Holliday junction resolvase RusA-like endonuclease
MVRQGGKLKVHLTFRPNDRRRRDVDNLIAMHKGALDGIADALGIDDSQFRLSAEIGGISKPPCVVVEIS